MMILTRHTLRNWRVVGGKIHMSDFSYALLCCSIKSGKHFEITNFISAEVQKERNLRQILQYLSKEHFHFILRSRVKNRSHFVPYLNSKGLSYNLYYISIKSLTSLVSDRACYWV